MQNKRLIIVGGGAAGFFCAVNAARMNPALEVTIVEKSSKILSKVKVSGGGRCNLTHSCFSISEMIKNYPRGSRFLKRAFHHFFTGDVMDWFSQRGVSLKTEPDRRMFPQSDSSQTIIDCLIREANTYKVSILMNREVSHIEFHPGDNISHFRLSFKNGESLESEAVCICSGGFPKANQYNWMTDLGIELESPVPSLFTFNMAGHSMGELMGISLEDVQVKIDQMKLLQRGPILITHWGLSGPVILRLSAFAARELAQRNYHFDITVNWLPEYNENTLQEEFRKLRMRVARKKMTNDNPFGLPQRLWNFHLGCCLIDPEIRWADLPGKKEHLLVKQLCAHHLQVKGKTTFKEEFVTAGGVKLSGVNPDTMESRKIPHLYFAGEVLDVDGVTGGFNFQHAWTSGWIAARSIAEGI